MDSFNRAYKTFEISDLVPGIKHMCGMRTDLCGTNITKLKTECYGKFSKQTCDHNIGTALTKVCDGDKKNIVCNWAPPPAPTVATTTTTTKRTPKPTTTTTTTLAPITESTDFSMFIIGGVCGGLLMLVLIIGLSVWRVKKHREKKAEASSTGTLRSGRTGTGTTGRTTGYSKTGRSKTGTTRNSTTRSGTTRTRTKTKSKTGSKTRSHGSRH